MQLDYEIGMQSGKPGMIADCDMVQSIETFYNESVPALFGTFVSRGPDEQSIAPPADPNHVTDPKLAKGVVVATLEQISAYRPGVVGLVQNANPAAYFPNQAVPVMSKGRIWVMVEDQVTEGSSDVYVRSSAGQAAGQTPGNFGASAAAGMTQLVGATYKTSTTGPNQLAIVEIDL